MLDHDRVAGAQRMHLVLVLDGQRPARVPQRAVDVTLPEASAQVRTMPMWPMMPSAPVRTRRCRTAPPLRTDRTTPPAPAAASAPPASSARSTPAPSPVMASTAPTAITSTPVPPAIPWVG